MRDPVLAHRRRARTGCGSMATLVDHGYAQGPRAHADHLDALRRQRRPRGPARVGGRAAPTPAAAGPRRPSRTSLPAPPTRRPRQRAGGPARRADTPTYDACLRGAAASRRRRSINHDDRTRANICWDARTGCGSSTGDAVIGHPFRHPPGTPTRSPGSAGLRKDDPPGAAVRTPTSDEVSLRDVGTRATGTRWSCGPVRTAYVSRPSPTSGRFEGEDEHGAGRDGAGPSRAAVPRLRRRPTSVGGLDTGCTRSVNDASR
jgi:hypothetical protein